MLQNGQTLAHFKIIKRLGAGGMGEVYLAEDTRLGRKVALKILLSDYFEDRERKERFYREAKTAAGISNPHVMSIHDLGSAPDPDSGKDLDYIVMEYIDGVSLSQHIERIQGDLKAIIRLAEQIAGGLNAAHQLKIVHRDIKADNIIINADGDSKILDFGLAKPITVYKTEESDADTDTISQELTRAGKIVGTVFYMSPEQIRGEQVDNRSDIFSFGILLYRMVTGSLPFQGETQVSTLAKILESPPEPPRTKNENIPPELERIIDKCLQKNPEDRYQDTRDLVVDLRSLRRQYDSNISSINSGVTDVSGLQAQRTKSKGILKSVVPSLVAVAFLAVIFWQIFSGEKGEFIPSVQAGEKSLAILGFENKTGDSTLNWLQTGLPEILVTDLARFQDQDLSIISRDRVVDCLEGEGHDVATGIAHPACLSAAGQLGARHALSGAFYKFGDSLRIDARVEEIASGRIILTEKVIGSNPLELTDSLTAKIAASLNFGTDSVKSASVTTYTSSSPEAYKAYHMAMEKFEKRLYDDAIAGFKKAIALDSAFALPYMRIGMAHVFDGRPQEGANWFARALKYENRLPNWDATMLDIYADLWLRNNFDDAFIKMELLIKNHPSDKETRYIYALMIKAFTRDSKRAFAEMDTALQLNPRYLSALIGYANHFINDESYDSALVYAERAREFHPDAPSGYFLLARIYQKTGEFERAAQVYKDMLIAFPGNDFALSRLNTVSIKMRRFDEARRYLEMLKESHGEDPYAMADYHAESANLDLWQGKFKSAMDNYFQVVDIHKKIGDSTLIASTYSTISARYHAFHMPDSAIYYSRQAFEWGNIFNRLDFPITMAAVAAPVDDSIVYLFKDVISTIAGRFPDQLAPLIDGLQDIFRGLNTGDTALVIEAHKEIVVMSMGGEAANKRTIGFLSVLTGRYQQGIEYLEPYIEGPDQTSSGGAYMTCRYYLGVANQELGNGDEAIRHFREMLQYWGNPDIELKEIKDARQRLARLTG